MPSEYVVGLLAEVFLNKEKGSCIVHDPRLVWNTAEIVNKFNGNAIVSKTGHAFVKAAMREVDAIYGGEISAHHYFRDFSYCDSGMIPWLVIWELMSTKNVSLFELIYERSRRFPSSGELNFVVSDVEKCIEIVKEYFAKDVILVEELDGLSMTFENWRFNLRKSNTEPLVRLNIETKGDQILLKEQTDQLRKIINTL